MRILIIEDEKKLSEALAAILLKNKYSADACGDGVEGLDCAMSGIYDVIILDIMLPGMNGFEVLKNLRAGGIKTPVILLTAKYEITDRVRGLDSGADDYLTKPFSSDELLARIRALSRRNAAVFGGDTLDFNDISLNISTYELCCGERSIKLGAKELQILELLIKYGGRICSKEEILVKVWGYDSDAEYNNVEVYISFLRKKLTHLHSAVQIKTVRSAGYCLSSEV